MGTKKDPGPFDCHALAEPDEPVFTIAARDEAGPDTLRDWARRRVFSGKNKPEDEQIVEALLCADAMEDWRAVNRK